MWLMCSQSWEIDSLPSILSSGKILNPTMQNLVVVLYTSLVQEMNMKCKNNFMYLGNTYKISPILAYIGKLHLIPRAPFVCTGNACKIPCIRPVFEKCP